MKDVLFLIIAVAALGFAELAHYYYTKAKQLEQSFNRLNQVIVLNKRKQQAEDVEYQHI